MWFFTFSKKWPDVYDGLLVGEGKIDAGMIKVTLELEFGINEGFLIFFRKGIEKGKSDGSFRKS